MRCALLLLAACGAAPQAPAVPAIATKLPAEVGDVVGIAEVGDATVVLDHQRAFVVRGGAVAAQIEAPHGWRAGTTVAALDGQGAWAVGLNDDGRLYRITLAGDLEDITDRFRLADVRALAAAGTTTAFATRDGVAVTADGLHELQATVAPPAQLAASNGRIALGGTKSVDVWDLATRQSRSYPLAARQLAFVGARLAAATRDGVYVEQQGTLPLPGAQIAAAGTRLWILAGDVLYALDGTTLRRAQVAVPHGAHLFATSRDAWLASTGSLVRASLDVDDPAWRAQVAPVFTRVCAHCHLPGGSAGVDLSTAASWRADHDELVRRVLVTGTMPPSGTDLTAADKDALRAWLTSTASRTSP
ncbi:MAG TPA: cytochrome c [Kofleriaceae bacterium]|nr:cytochrome c [Kofleriaceae bacterium]